MSHPHNHKLVNNYEKRITTIFQRSRTYLSLEYLSKLNKGDFVKMTNITRNLESKSNTLVECSRDVLFNIHENIPSKLLNIKHSI